MHFVLVPYPFPVSRTVEPDMPNGERDGLSAWVCDTHRYNNEIIYDTICSNAAKTLRISEMSTISTAVS